jgi:secreted trypsin-like serine protease
MGGIRSGFIAVAMGFLLGCSPVAQLASQIDANEIRWRNAAARNCQAGDLGVGFIGGKKLASASSIAKSTIAVVSGSSLCTGTLIGEDMVLTAAHCLNEQEGVKVYFSTDLYCDLAQGAAIKGEVQSFLRHETYRQHEKASDYTIGQLAFYDFALLRLKNKVFDRSRILAVKKERAQPLSDSLVGAGFGLTSGPRAHKDQDPMLMFGFLKEKTMFSIDDSTAMRDFKLQEAELQHFVFVEQKPSGICLGDSGGALMALSKSRLQQIAVASYVFNPDSDDDVCAGTGVYVRLAAQWDWLKASYSKLSPLTKNPF